MRGVGVCVCVCVCVCVLTSSTHTGGLDCKDLDAGLLDDLKITTREHVSHQSRCLGHTNTILYFINVCVCVCVCGHTNTILYLLNVCVCVCVCVAILTQYYTL